MIALLFCLTSPPPAKLPEEPRALLRSEWDGWCRRKVRTADGVLYCAWDCEFLLDGKRVSWDELVAGMVGVDEIDLRDGVIVKFAGSSHKKESK